MMGLILAATMAVGQAGTAADAELADLYRSIEAETLRVGEMIGLRPGAAPHRGGGMVRRSGGTTPPPPPTLDEIGGSGQLEVVDKGNGTFVATLTIDCPSGMLTCKSTVMLHYIEGTSGQSQYLTFYPSLVSTGTTSWTWTSPLMLAKRGTMVFAYGNIAGTVYGGKFSGPSLVAVEAIP